MMDCASTYREWLKEPYRISTDPAQLDLDVIHGFLSQSYWAKGIPRVIVERSIANSIPFGLYHGREQAGFARVVSDNATSAYLCDVFILPPFRGQGLGRWLCQTALSLPDLHGIRRWVLATNDAHPLYASIGFRPLRQPERFMEISNDDAYPRGGVSRPALRLIIRSRRERPRP
jgi:GNAT superfamily N-acetyltransferase